MIHKGLIVVLLLVVGEFLQLSNGLKCYVCNSAFHKDCDTSPPSIEFIVECNRHTAQPILVEHGKLSVGPMSNTNMDPESVNKTSSASSAMMPSENATNSNGTSPETTGRTARIIRNIAALNDSRNKSQKLQNILANDNEYHLTKDGQTNFNYTYCRKTISSIPLQHNKDNIKQAVRRVIRSCGWMDETTKMNTCKWSDVGEIQNEYCICNSKEGCNGGIRIQASVTWIPAMIAILFMMMGTSLIN